MTYQEEMDYLVSNDSRNEFICNLVYSLKGNTLVLFQYVEKHGAVLHGKMFKRLGDKITLCIWWNGCNGQGRG